MRLAKIILAITAAVWICYGGWLFFDPTGLRYAGFELTHWSAIVEVQAMYGAVEIVLGFFALLGVLKPQRYMHPALLLWFLIYSALVLGRLVGIGIWDGSYALSFGADALPDSYNPGALWVLEADIPRRHRWGLINRLACTLLPYHRPDSLAQPEWASQWFADEARGVDMTAYYPTALD